MEKEPVNEIGVHDEAVKRVANPAATLCFMFGTLSFLFWADLLGLYGEGSQIVLGLVQLGVFCAYHMCAQNLMRRYEEFDGNIFMIFAAMFGGVGGLLNVSGALCAHFGIPYSATAPGTIWLLCGLILLLVTPAVRTQPKVGFAFYVAGGLGLFIMGLMALDIAPASVAPVVAWLLFIAGALGILVSVSTFYSFKGITIPLGKPFFKQ